MDGSDKVRIGVIGAGGRGRLSRYVVTDNLGGVITALVLIRRRNRFN